MSMSTSAAFLATSLASEERLDIEQPNMSRPSVTADRRPVAALVVRAIYQETANAGGAHLFKGDVLLAGEGGHSAIKARRD
jgi:hypothetical protein